MDIMAPPMAIVPPEIVAPMVIHPPQGGTMSIQSSSDFMPVIPTSGYPPMDILPVTEDARREFLEGNN